MDERRIAPERHRLLERPTPVSMDDIRERQSQWESDREQNPLQIEYVDEGVFVVRNFGRTMQEIIGPERYAHYLQSIGRIRIEQSSKPSILGRMKSLGGRVLHYFSN